MNRNLAIPLGNQSVTGTAVSVSKRLLIMGVVALVTNFLLFAQNSALQEKLAAVKQAVAANQQKLHQYQWIETTQLTLNGDPEASFAVIVPVRP